MKTEANKKITPLHGIIPPLVTPLTTDGSLDVPGLRNVVERCINGGVHALFVLGTTAEWAALDDPMRLQVIDVCSETAAGRVPLYVHVTDTRFSASIALARHAQKRGATAIVASSPYYLPMRQSELVRYVNLLLEQQDLPVILYNIPQFTKTQYAPETLNTLLDNPRVIAIKDSSGDVDYQHALIRVSARRPDFSVLCGSEGLMTQMIRLGARGCVGGGANLMPELLVGLYDAIVAGNEPEVTRLQSQLETLGGLFDAPTTAASIHNLKWALAQIGVIASDRMGDPYGDIELDAPNVRRVLAALGFDEPVASSTGQNSQLRSQTPVVA